MAITIENGARVLYRWERGVALTVTKPCDILRLYREDDRVGVELTPTWSGSTGSVTIPDRMLTESGYLHAARVEKADGEERIIETARFLVRDAQKPGNHAASTKEVRDWETLKLQMEALERAAREGEFDGADGITPHVGENGNWFIGDVDTGVHAQGDPGDTPYIGENGYWYIGETDTGVRAKGENGITPHIGANGNWFIGEYDTGVHAQGDPGITPHIGENGNWFIGEYDTGVLARNEDVSFYADDLLTSGILGEGAMSLEILAPEGSNVIRYRIDSAVVYVKGVRRARGAFSVNRQAVGHERLIANVLRYDEAKGSFSWTLGEVVRDGEVFVNVDNGEIYPTRSDGYYDLVPYLVHIHAGATSITTEQVEDLRADERYCGYVRSRFAPTKVSELENDAGYVTDDQIENVITTEPQELTDAEKAQARANIGAAAVGEGGSGGGTVAGAPKNVWFGTCDTAADVMDKVVTTTTGDFRLEEGNILYVYFKNALQITTAFLNVDGTGSVSSNAFNGSYNAGDVVVFAYSNGMFYRTNRTEATTTFKGVVKLSSSTSSSSETMAATPKAVREAYMRARSAEELALDAQDAAGAAKTLAENAQPKGDYALRSDIPDVPVQSVNGKTGAVQLTAGDVGAASKETVEQLSETLAGKVNKDGLTLGLHSDGKYYIFVDGAPIGTGLDISRGDVFGYVDANNNVVLNGNLPDGNYSIKYEMEDGTTVDVGELVLGDEEPEAKNYFNIDTATLNHRLGSSGSPSSYNGMVVTDFIPWEEGMSGKKFKVSGTDPCLNTAYNYYGRVCYYDASKTYVTGYNAPTDEFHKTGIPTTITGYTGGGFMRVALVIKDNAAITKDDIANLKFTLE